MSDDPNLATIIDLMNKCFLGDEIGFDQFVIGSFLFVYNKLPNQKPLAEKINILIKEIHIQRNIHKLLAKIEEKYADIFSEDENNIFQTKQDKIKYQRYKAINQLRQYLQRYLVLEQLQPFYSSCRPDRADRTVTDIENMVTQLDRLFPKYSPLIPFVVQVKQQFPEINQSLENWLAQYGNLFGYTEFQKTSNSTLNPSSTLIVHSSASSLLISIKKLNPNYLQLQAWFWSSQRRRCHPIQEKEIIEIDNKQSELNQRYQKLAEKFTELIEKANIFMKKHGDKSLRIEIFSQTKLLQENDYIDWIKIKKSGFFVEMCKQYIVVFRLAERLEEQSQDLKENWEDKWRQVTLNNPVIVDYSSDIECQLNQARTIGIKLDCVSNYPNFFNLFYLKALPIALWSRCDLKKSSCLAEINRILTNLSVQQNFQNLLQEIKNERNAAPVGTEHIGHHICLLWDDPERMPPEPQKIDNALISF